jgi:hypothetical protein
MDTSLFFFPFIFYYIFLWKIQNEALGNALNLKRLICNEVIVELKICSVKDGIILFTYNIYNPCKYINFKKNLQFSFFN